MPRGRSSSSSRSSYGGNRGSSFSRSPQPQQRTQMPQQQHQQTTVQPRQGGGMMSGIGSTIVQGMAFGAGSEVAHQAVRSVMGGSSHSAPQQVQEQQPMQQQNYPQEQPMQQNNKCFSLNEKFVNCLKQSGNDISDCQNLFNDLKSCESGI